jgi:hypothetical protein
MGDIANGYGVLVAKPLGKRPLRILWWFIG